MNQSNNNPKTNDALIREREQLYRDIGERDFLMELAIAEKLKMKQRVLEINNLLASPRPQAVPTPKLQEVEPAVPAPEVEVTDSTPAAV